jgi:hypothetical protein
MIMEGDPLVLIEGMTIAGFAVGATQGYIYLRIEYPHAYEILNAAITNAYAANYLGENIQGSWQNVPFRSSSRCRRVCLRRRNIINGKFRRQTRFSAFQTTITSH